MEITKYSLNAGELSDELAGRIDLSKIQMGMRRAENVRVLRAGGVTRRAGFRYVGVASNQSSPPRLQGFRFSGSQGYVVEFGDFTIRILYNGGFITDGNGDPVQFTTPWGIDQVFGLHFAQRINQVIVTHPEVEPHLITFNSATSWAVTVFPWQERIWELATDLPINLSASALTGSVTITASAAVFTSAWVGTRLQLTHVRPQSPIRRQVSDAVGLSVALDLASGSYAEGSVVHLGSVELTNSLEEFLGYSITTPPGNYSYFTLLQDYDSEIDYVSDNDTPNQYPAFFMQGAIAIPAQEVRGQWEFETEGTWTGTYVVERSYDNGATWQALRVLASSNNKNYLVQDVEETDSTALIRVLILDFNSDQGAIWYSFTLSPASISGIALVTAYNSSTSVTATVERPLESTTPTSDWREDAFNPKNGYAHTCTFHQKRLFFGGSKGQPQSIWASRIRQPFNFSIGALADDGMIFETEASEYEAVLWLSSHLSLVVGTTSGIWAISSPDGQSLTPESNSIARQARNGVDGSLPALPLESNLIYVQSKGQKIRELTGGTIEYGGYVDVDLTQLASHITRGEITQVESYQIPDTSLILVKGNGELAILTYERAQNVVGWTRWNTDGKIESVAACSGGGVDDDIYIVVQRDGERFIEWMVPDMLEVEENNDTRNVVFLDSSITHKDEAGFDEVAGLNHFAGKDVTVFADGRTVGVLTVATDGILTLPKTAFNVTVGRPYETFIETMPLDQGTIGNKSGISEVIVRLRNSLGAEASQNQKQWTRLDVGQRATPEDEPYVLESGDAVSTNQGSWGRQPTFSIRQTTPLPLTVLAIRLGGKTSR